MKKSSDCHLKLERKKANGGIPSFRRIQLSGMGGGYRSRQRFYR